jgi:hypothetical protein
VVQPRWIHVVQRPCMFLYLRLRCIVARKRLVPSGRLARGQGMMSNVTSAVEPDSHVTSAREGRMERFTSLGMGSNVTRTGGARRLRDLGPGGPYEEVVSMGGRDCSASGREAGA